MSLVNNSESELDSRDARLDFENVLQDILEKANALERYVCACVEFFNLV